MIKSYVTKPYDYTVRSKMDKMQLQNLWASVDKENSGVFPPRLQVVRLVYHPIKLEA